MSKLVILFYVLSTVGGLVVLKKGTSTGSPISLRGKRIHFIINKLTVLGIFLYIVSFLFYAYLISEYELGIIIPLLAAFVYLVLFITSYLIFNETFTKRKIFAISLIIAGVVLMGMHGV